MRVYPKRKGERTTTNIPAASLRNEHFKADSITANEIAADTITANEISADYIEVGGATADINSDEGIDGINDGTLYGKVGKTDISGGHIKLHYDTVADGQWYDSSGVEIDASHGINIYGTDSALTTRATKTGTIQCYVGANGNFYCGAGDVYLASNGITIKGSAAKLNFSYSSYTASLQLTSSGLFSLNGNIALLLNAPIYEDIYPYTDAYPDLGLTTKQWNNGYFSTYVKVSSAGGGLMAQNIAIASGSQDSSVGSSGSPYKYGYFTDLYRTTEHDLQHHDDIALIRAMKEDPNRPGYIDKRTVPSILKVPVSELRAKEQAEINQRYDTELTGIRRKLNDPNLERFTDDFKADEAQLQGDRLKELQELTAKPNEDFADIDFYKEHDLTLGAIRQIADKLDVMQAAIDALKGG